MASQPDQQPNMSAQDLKTLQPVPSQYSSLGHVPHVPPHPSGPQVRPSQRLVQSGAQVPSGPQ